MNPIFERPTVCNCGPLIGLGRIGLATLPFDLFPSVHVPEEVVGELLCSDSPDAPELRKALSRAQIVPAVTSVEPMLLAELDLGESAVIAAAASLGASSVIIDERKARRIASTVYNFQVKGSAGLLLEAKRRGLVSEVLPCLRRMIDGGYFISESVVNACATAANEI